MQTTYPNNGSATFDEATTEASLHFHVCNGGGSFHWKDSLLSLQVDSEGWCNAELSFGMHPQNLRELSAWLLEIAEKEERKFECKWVEASELKKGDSVSYSGVWRTIIDILPANTHLAFKFYGDADYGALMFPGTRCMKRV